MGDKKDVTFRRSVAVAVLGLARTLRVEDELYAQRVVGRGDGSYKYEDFRSDVGSLKRYVSSFAQGVEANERERWGLGVVCDYRVLVGRVVELADKLRLGEDVKIIARTFDKTKRDAYDLGHVTRDLDEISLYLSAALHDRDAYAIDSLFLSSLVEGAVREDVNFLKKEVERLREENRKLRADYEDALAINMSDEEVAELIG